MSPQTHKFAEVQADAARLRAAFDALPVGVVVADGSGAAAIRNAAAHTLGGHANVLLDAAVEAQLSNAMRGASATETIEFFGPPKRVMIVRALPLPDGGAIATIEDVSERARLDSVRTDFVANISHELKTPVGALAVLAEALEDSVDDPDLARRLAERITNEAHRVSRTIDDLLELSRIELGGKAIQQEVDVVALLHEAVDRHAATAAQRSVILRVDERAAPSALGDRRQLTSAVANLVDNAVKYSDAGGEIVVTAGRDDDGWVVIDVTDQGVGIPTRDLDRVFERFYRVDHARSRETGGTGLGLAIVRHVATNHGGEVLVQSEEGVGSTFTLRIPAAVGRLEEGG
jgi:two-component system sensor histidine kinase SenX3